MSADTERVGTETDTSLLESWQRWYHLPVLGALMVLMAWIRLRPLENFSYNDGTPQLQAVDSYYHWRTVEWTAENYPWTMPYEIWTSFPTGRYVGQFGTLFDQIIVTVAMIVGLGDPSGETLFTVSLVVVPIMAALVAIPVFYIGRRLGGTFGGIVSVLILALAPGTFLSRTTAGQLQHHVAEVLFMAIAVLAMMVALRVAEQDRPIWELVDDRDADALRRPALYSALAGVALTLYIWVWPPGIVLIGIFGVFFAVHLCLDYVRGRSPDHVAFVGAVSLGLTALLTLLLVEEPGTSVTSFGYLQPFVAATIAVGCVFMAWLARTWDDRDIEPMYYPLAIGGLILLAFGVMALVLPDFFSTIYDNLARRLIPFGPETTDVTIQEARAPADFTSHVFDEFGAAFYTMLAGLAFLIARPFLGREYRAEYTLIIVWSLFLLSMAATQLRFAYYLVLAVAVVNAVFIADIVRLFQLDLSGSIDSLRQVETYQVIVVVLVVLLLFAPLLPPFAAAGAAWEQTPGDQPHPDTEKWDESTTWLAENTPEVGDYGEYENSHRLEYLGSYDYPDGGDYDYPPGSYGVLSWWDYGHLITTQAERIPHANPFQSGASSAAEFFTAQSEDDSEAVLNEIGEGEGEEMRYVMIDDGMVGPKFGAIAQWADSEHGAYMVPEDYEQGDPISVDELDEVAADSRYEDTTLSRLYFDDAAGMENYRLVHESEQQSAFVSYAITQGDQVLQDDDGNPEIVLNQQLTPQLQQQLMMFEQQTEYGVEIFDQRQDAAVKTYERVDGATIDGTVDDADLGDDDDTSVEATLDLETEHNGSVEYTQTGDLADDGSFELDVSYATDDELGVEDGYTDSSVEAIDDDYTVTIYVDGEAEYEGQVSVTESAVVNGETVEITDFEPVEDDGDDENDEGDDSEGGEGGDGENGDDE
ncbi:oligosaccharyl transferase, archaeosortase A system-associated [Halobacteria archaeon AArc-dxtr1]|nr:oligosaccharyl transferase, archaeosortase A system-associated [Halobacteria archaeon AArc-dxtr1]